VGFSEVKAVVLGALEKGRTEEIRIAACSTAGRLGLAEAAASLEGIVKREKEKYLGLYAVQALQRIGWKGGLGGFLHVLGQTPKAETRNACLKAVVELASTADIPELLSMTKSNKTDYRDAAALALARMAWAHRQAQLDARPVVTGESIGEPLEPFPVGPDVIDRLLDMIEKETAWEARDAARTAILRIGKPAEEKVRQRLPGLIDFGDDDTAQTAMELVGLYGATEARRTLLKVALHEEDRTRRMFAARALEGAGAEEAVVELAKGLEPREKAKDSELNAVRALGYVRHKAAFDALVGMLDVPGWSDALLREIEFSLERLTGHRFGRERPAVWKKWFADSKSPLHTRVKALNRAANRRNAIDKGLFGLTRETERCVENGLRFLESVQHVGGWWDGNEKGFGGVIGCEPAYTGLSLLALLGAGYSPTSGKYRESVRRALEFLMATQFYDGSYPVTGGGDESWIFAYLIAMGVWGINEAYATSIGVAGQPRGDPWMRRSAQAGIDYLVRVQTPGGGWRYGPRYVQSDTSCTSWVLMTLKTADLAGLDLAQRSMDGIDSWLERCSFDITGETETPADLASDYEYEVGQKRRFKAFTGYLELSGKEASALQQVSMTAVGMTCRFFMGWKRSHPFQIGSANYLSEFLPQWMKGLEKGMAIAWYHYYWYYGTLSMYQMGGKYWRAWNEKIRRMYPQAQRTSPAELAGSWDPDSAVLNGGRLFSTAMSILTLETYYRFSPLLGDEAPPEGGDGAEKKGGPGGKPGDKPDGK
jgi:HEAT repeat protein